MSAAPEITFILPCLNEETTVGLVVEEARRTADAAGATAEILVVDNGSTDASVANAEAAGATVVHEPRRGYGSAYLAGLDVARGTYVVMLDADASYDLSRLDRFLELLRDGADLVMGTRLRGTIQPAAMPWTHRWIGNPILTGMLNLLFRARVSDAHCGLRAIRRSCLPKLKLAATGMEFAGEMVIKAAKARVRIEEVPVIYRPRGGESKLRGVPDAWRNVRLMLVHSPTFLFAVPGGGALVAGLVALTVLALDTSSASWKTPIAIVAAVAALLGAQLLQLGLFARTYAVLYLDEREPTLERAWRRLQLEHGLLAAAVVVAVGIAVAVLAHFDDRQNPRLGLLGLTLVALGAQGVFGAFFLSILGLTEHARGIRGRARGATAEAQQT